MARITCVHCALPLLETRTNPDPQTLREAAELYSRRCVCRLPNDTLQGLEDGTPEALTLYRQFLSGWHVAAGRDAETAERLVSTIRYPLHPATVAKVRLTLERRRQLKAPGKREPSPPPKPRPKPARAVRKKAVNRKPPAKKPFPKLERMLDEMGAHPMLRGLAHQAASAMQDEEYGIEMVRGWKGEA